MKVDAYRMLVLSEIIPSYQIGRDSQETCALIQSILNFLTACGSKDVQHPSNSTCQRLIQLGTAWRTRRRVGGED